MTDQCRNVLIVGAGQLGSRHLQGASQVKTKINLLVVDKSPSSIKNAIKRYGEMDFNPSIKNISYFNDLNEIRVNEIDLAIVATTADIRANIIVALNNQFAIKKIILEKILFQKESDYWLINNLIKINKITAWVNHPRRSFPFYKKLKKELELHNKYKMKVTGGSWGLACNGLHFIELISYLTERKELNLDTSHLESFLLESKRKGFYEVMGTIKGKIGEVDIELNCDQGDSPIEIEINSEFENLYIYESHNKIINKNLKSNKINYKSKKILYNQSEITGVLIDSILNESKCDLPYFEDVMEQHLLFTKKIMQHINKHSTKEFDYCPIT